MSRIKLLPQYAGVIVKPRARDYLVDGERYQRVTTALGIINKPALIPWAKRVTLKRVEEILLNKRVSEELAAVVGESPAAYAEFIGLLIADAGKASGEERDARADLGTEAHAHIHTALTLHPDEVPPYVVSLAGDQQPPVRAALDFVKSHGITVVEAEAVVWDDILKVAGTIDGVGEIGDDLVIWDWKTGAGIYWETALQLAAYSALLMRVTGRRVSEAFAVRLPHSLGETYEYRRLTRDGLGQAFNAYIHALHLNRARNEELWVDE